MASPGAKSVPRLALEVLQLGHAEKHAHRKRSHRSRHRVKSVATEKKQLPQNDRVDIPSTPVSKSKKAKATASPASATSAPTAGRESSRKIMPSCPNCGHRRVVTRCCYWDDYSEWVYLCGFEGPCTDPVFRTGSQYRHYLDSLVNKQLGIEDAALGTNQNNNKNSATDLSALATKDFCLAIVAPLALTFTDDKVDRFFCGYRWRQNSKIAICDECWGVKTIDLLENEPRYWCKKCYDHSC